MLVAELIFGFFWTFFNTFNCYDVYIHTYIQVNLVQLNSDESFIVSYEDISDPSSRPLFHEGSNKGQARGVKTKGPEKKEEFDIVVIATPMTKDKTILKVEGVDFNVPDKRYIKLRSKNAMLI